MNYFHLLLDFIGSLKNYQIILESFSLILYLTSFISLFLRNSRALLWGSFIRRTSLLIAFSTLAIPWMLSEIL